MRIDVLTIFPKFFENAFDFSIVKKAKEKKLVTIEIHDIRKYSTNKQKSVDDYQFGGGPGMVMNIQPIDDCIEKLKSARKYDEIIYLTPDAKSLAQLTCNTLSSAKNLIMLCGHYKGIDQRVRDNLVTMELSIGDYVLSGGELPAAVLCDSIIRLIPGVLNDETSALEDSFQDGLIAPPVYTRPSKYKNLKVPKILLSGDPKKVKEWREKKSDEKTKTIKP